MRDRDRPQRLADADRAGGRHSDVARATSPAPSTPVPATPARTIAPTPTVRPTSPPSTPTPTARPTTRPSAPPGDAPYCAVDDQLTPYRSYDDYARTYLDWTYRLPPSYVPPDLLSTSLAGFTGESATQLLRDIAMPDLGALRQAAGRAGFKLELFSGYRSYVEQERTFNYWVSVGGYEQALRTSARPGHSEHQLGTSVDLGSTRTPPWQYADWATTPAGSWVATHAWEYGFVMSYPAGKERVTCYSYEPWHYRWVGRTVTRQVRASGLTLREYQSRYTGELPPSRTAGACAASRSALGGCARVETAVGTKQRAHRPSPVDRRIEAGLPQRRQRSRSSYLGMSIPCESAYAQPDHEGSGQHGVNATLLA